MKHKVQPELISKLLFNYDFKHEIKLKDIDILIRKLQQKLDQFKCLESLLHMLFDTDEDMNKFFSGIQSENEKCILDEFNQHTYYVKSGCHYNTYTDFGDGTNHVCDFCGDKWRNNIKDMHYLHVTKVSRKPFMHITYNLFYVHNQCLSYFLMTIKLAPYFQKLTLISCALTDNTSLVNMLNSDILNQIKYIIVKNFCGI